MLQRTPYLPKLYTCVLRGNLLLFEAALYPRQVRRLASQSSRLPSRKSGVIDKLTAVRRDRIGKTVGRLDDAAMIRVNRAVRLWLGLAAGRCPTRPCSTVSLAGRRASRES